MDVATATAWFDTIPVYDAYSNALLFYGQLDLYDLSERDGGTSWRRTLSTTDLTAPARGCITIGGDQFVVGRQVNDMFEGDTHRTYLLLHPADESVQIGTAATFLGGGTPTTLYAGGAWLKNMKVETEASESIPMYEYYVSASESPTPGMVLKDSGGVYYRVQVVDRRTGGLKVVVCYELGSTAVQTCTYTPNGAYSVVNDAYAAGTPITASMLVEGWRSQYRYTNMAVRDFERGDAVITVRAATVASPVPGEIVAATAQTYKILSRQSDGAGCWELHGRPI